MQAMTEGNVTKQMISFALPLLVGNILQQLYNTVDSIIVGHFAGTAALAAVGTSAPIMNILTFLIVGITMGISVLLSEFFGAGNYEKVKEEEMTAFLGGLVFTIALSLFGHALIRPMLSCIRTPDDIMPQAEAYLGIITAGLVFSYLYNILAASLRSIGDSKTPLVFLILSSLLNIVLSILLVKHFGLGVRGSALGTIISQAVSAILCTIYIYWKVPILQLNFRNVRINWLLLMKTASYSSVSAIQQTFLYVGIFILQGAINPLGVDTIAAYNAVSKIDGFVLAPTGSLALSLTTFTSQNHGANRPDRIRSGLKNAVCIAIVYCFILSVFTFFSAHTLMTFFLDAKETVALSIGENYLKIMAVFYLLPAFCNSFQGFFRGLGRMDVTLWATVIQIPVRVALAYFLVGYFGMPAVAISIATGWVCMIIYESIQFRMYLKQQTRSCIEI